MTQRNPLFQLSLATALMLAAAAYARQAEPIPQSKIRVVLDTDANNELDDQHAIAYLLFNRDPLEVEGITVSRTRSGGGIDEHGAEAERVVRLSGRGAQIPVLKKADGSFAETIANQNWSEVNLLKPIPQRELDNNPNLSQNTGY
jgi:purine nucleosidase